MRGLDGITNSVDMKLGQILRDTEGQGGLVCCCPQGPKELDRTKATECTHIYFP